MNLSLLREGSRLSENYYPYDLTRENAFWLRLFKDHSQFIMGTLVPGEVAFMTQAQQFMNIFDTLLVQNEAGCLKPEDAMQAVCQFRNYKQGIANMLLIGQVVINLPPGALKEMLDEVDAYLAILCGTQPMNEAEFLLHQHRLWLPNMAAHAALAASQLDPSETIFFNRFEHFHMTFHELQLKAEELMHLLKNCPSMVPPLAYLTKQSTDLTREFYAWLEQYKSLRSTGQVMAITPPLLIDHFMREAAYYLEKISRT
jgi:hypothetical protein